MDATRESGTRRKNQGITKRNKQNKNKTKTKQNKKATTKRPITSNQQS